MATTYRPYQIDNIPPNIVDGGIYADIRYDADDSAPTYIGLNRLNGASTSTDETWKIYKFTYSGSNVTRIQLAYGAWDNRASLF